MITVTPYVMNYEWRLEQEERQSNEKKGKNFLRQYGRITENVACGKIYEWISSGLIAQPEYFINPEKYFWVDGAYLRLLGTDLSFRLGIINRGSWDVLYPQRLTEEEKKAVDQLYGANHPLANPNEALRAIYDYLSSIETTPYYKALMEFKWRTGLLSFPLFDRYMNKYLDEARLDEALHQAEESRAEEETAVAFNQYIDSFADLIRIEK